VTPSCLRAHTWGVAWPWPRASSRSDGRAATRQPRYRTCRSGCPPLPRVLHLTVTQRSADVTLCCRPLPRWPASRHDAHAAVPQQAAAAHAPHNHRHHPQTPIAPTPPPSHAPAGVTIQQFVLGYLCAQAALLFVAMSFACESSIAVSTSAAIVMTMNQEEHRSRWGCCCCSCCGGGGDD